MNNTTTTIITIVVVFSLFLFVVFLTNTIIVYSQQVPPSSNTPAESQSPSPPASPKLHAVKIISPVKGQQVPASKDLTISGTSIDNATSNCQVSVIVNHVRPYQPATAAGTEGGANDYSNWNFVLTSNYATIKPGPDNRITAKYTCIDNPNMVSYSSVNVIGMVAAAAPAATTAYTPPQQQQNTITSNNNATTTSNGNSNNITAQDKPSLKIDSNKNNTESGHPDPLSDALDSMSDALHHLFG